MKEKNNLTTSLFKRILVNCSVQAKQYGSCVAARVPEVEHDMCSKEFLLLKNCMQNVDTSSNMNGAGSSSNHTGSSGSNALSHVYIQQPPLRCHIPGSRKLFHDDANKLMLALTSDQVFSWKLAPCDPRAVPSSDPVSGGPVLSIRYSLDLKLLAIQRSTQEIQIWNKESGDTYSHKYRSELDSILGFFWTDCPSYDIVFVKTSGLDLFSYNSESKSLHLVEAKKLNISWYIYTHESRLLLLASGMQCKSFSGYQLSSVGKIRLPKFEMAMAKSESNAKPVLAAEDVHIITVYGRIYCLQFDRVAMQLHSYRFYRDAVLQQGSLPIYSSRIAVSVVDHVLFVHQVDAKVVIIYDLFSDSQVPISAPLPLLSRGFSRSMVVSSQTPSGALEQNESADSEVILYGDQWNFLVPDLVCDITTGFVWKIHLDLESISASSSEALMILAFLQRRKLEAKKAKHLSLSIVRTIILERKPISLVAKAINVLLTTYSLAIKTGSYYKKPKAEETSVSGSSNVSSISAIDNDSTGPDASGKSTSDSDTSIGKDITSSSQISPPLGPGSDSSALQESQTTSAANSPTDLCSFVFARVEEEMVGDGSYLVAIIVEFLRSANSEKLKVHPSTYVLIVQILARDERYVELGSYIMNKIIEPSKEVASQLLESGRQSTQIRKLGVDMHKQLSLHHDYVLLLVQDGYYLEALRYARKFKVNTVRPTLFLEAAYASQDIQKLAAVLRFFSDFIPGFKNTSDFNTYHRMITDTSSSRTISSLS